jgi:DNA-binding transcriptional LysR family regulator
MNKPTLDARILANVNTFAAVVETGSFIRAAQALGLTQSAVSHAIARLEARVCIRLLHRTTRSVKLTAEGEAFYQQVAPLLHSMRNAVTTASGSSAVVQGRLRVNVDPFFASLLLAPAIGRFLDRHPLLSLELITRPQLGDLVADGFDIAIRFGDQPASSLVVRKLLDTRILTVATPTYLERHGHPTKPADLTAHPCLQFRDPVTGQPFEWEFHRGRKIVPVQTSGRLIVSDAGTLLSACLAGIGIAQVMELGVHDLLQRGKLIDLFPDWPDERFPLNAYYPSRQLPPAKLRAFIDFVLDLTKTPKP